MARLNISIPDPLHERLERLRDRMNLSEVCTVALERAAAVVEAQAGGADPLVARMLQRLQTARETWRRRGDEDGRRWAAEQATLDELHVMAREGARGSRFIDALYRNIVDPPMPGEDAPAVGTVLPDTFSLDRAMERWVAEDARRLRAASADAPADPSGTGRPLDDDSAHQAARERIEYHTYLEGWRDAVVEMWTIAQKALG